MNKRLITVVVLFITSATCWADYEDGLAARQRGDYSTAVREFTALAERGHPEAQFNLGLLHQNGQGVPQSYAEAAKWYTEAAQHGLAEAQYRLGKMYEKGEGVQQSKDDAIGWYEKAANQGHTAALAAYYAAAWKAWKE
jgi:TPR repeat protein